MSIPPTVGHKYNLRGVPNAALAVLSSSPQSAPTKIPTPWQEIPRVLHMVLGDGDGVFVAKLLNRSHKGSLEGDARRSTLYS